MRVHTTLSSTTVDMGPARAAATEAPLGHPQGVMDRFGARTSDDRYLAVEAGPYLQAPFDRTGWPPAMATAADLASADFEAASVARLLELPDDGKGPRA